MKTLFLVVSSLFFLRDAAAQDVADRYLTRCYEQLARISFAARSMHAEYSAWPRGVRELESRHARLLDSQEGERLRLSHFSETYDSILIADFETVEEHFREARAPEECSGRILIYSRLDEMKPVAEIMLRNETEFEWPNVQLYQARLMRYTSADAGRE